MAKIKSGVKKCCSAVALCIAFLCTVILIVTGMCIALNYADTGVLTYKVAPVNYAVSIINHFKGDSVKDTVAEETSNSSNDNEVTVVDDNSLVSLVENVMPSIVAINCTVEIEGYGYSFFGGGQRYESTSSGSGIIIAQNSYEILIVTNNHVIEDATDVQVEFINEETCKASVKGADPSSDLAVISVSGNDITKEIMDDINIATLGNSDNLKVGDVAIAIGNSMGYGQSITRGVISALNRDISSEDCTMSLIQTDSAINPGNSGGALLNARGEVIGINCAKDVATEVESIGYAIPITDAIDIINDLINYEEVEEGEQAYFGIVAYTVSDQMTSYFNCSQGAYVKSVTKDSPADQAGIVAGDVITEFSGRKVKSMEELQDALKYRRAGDQTKITFERLENGKYVEHTVDVTFASKSEFEDKDKSSEE